jgi:hypothetical protein
MLDLARNTNDNSLQDDDERKQKLQIKSKGRGIKATLSSLNRGNIRCWTDLLPREKKQAEISPFKINYFNFKMCGMLKMIFS